MMMEIGSVFVIAAVLSLITTPWVMRLATKVHAIDNPDERKIHRRPTPRLGGVALTVSFFVTVAFGLSVFPDLRQAAWADPTTGGLLLVASLAMLGLGMWDDMRVLGPGRKFFVQLLLSALVYGAGVRIAEINNPFGAGELALGMLSFPVTLLWIIGVTNAVNLIDGLDGLAAGVSIIAAVTMGAVALVTKGDVGTALLTAILAGAILGFLRYNFNPARIFLGDSGSLFVGFVLAIVSIQSTTKGSTAFAISVSMLALGLPMMDTVLSVVRRLLRPFVSSHAVAQPLFRVLKSIFRPDRDHIHHRLLDNGFSQREVVLMLYLVSTAFGCSAVALTVASKAGAELILVAVGSTMVFGLRQLRYREIAIFRTGLLLPAYQWPILKSTFFHLVVDGCFIAGSFLLAHAAGTGGSGGVLQSVPLPAALAGIVALQLAVFLAMGLYKGTVRLRGVADSVKIVKTVASSVGVVALLQFAFDRGISTAAVTILTLDFFFLLTLVGFSRFSFLLLSYLREEDDSQKKPVLIYGAGQQGIMTLNFIRSCEALQVKPVGFLDDDPNLEGKVLHGYPIFGGHWKIQRLQKLYDVREILLADDAIKPEVLRRLRELSRTSRIGVRRFSPTLEPVRTTVTGVPAPEVAAAKGAAPEVVRGMPALSPVTRWDKI